MDAARRAAVPRDYSQATRNCGTIRRDMKPTRVSCVAAIVLLAATGAVRGAPAIHVDGEAGVGYDGNPANAQFHRDKAQTGFSTVRAAIEAAEVLTPHVALAARAQVAGEKLWDANGLSNAKGTLLVRATLRPDGGFFTPGLSGWLSWSDWEFDSDLRDSHEMRGGIAIDQPLTTKLAARLDLRGYRRSAADPVFDLEGQSAALALSWLVTQAFTTRLAYEFASGQIVATGTPTDSLERAGQVDTADDALGHGIRAYRMQADTQIATADFNWRLTRAFALDLQLQGVHSEGRWNASYERGVALASVLARF